MNKFFQPLLFSILFAFINVHALAEAPASPLRDASVKNTQRYRIIPWEEMQRFGLANFKNRTEQENLIGVIINIDHANLGGYTDKNLAQGIFMNDTEAINIWKALLAWLPGNFVVGPENRVLGNPKIFDETALHCLKSVNPRLSYTNIFDQWRNPETTVEEKKKILLLIASTASANAATSPCWK